MGPLGFGQPRLWIAFLEPSAMMSAQLTQIEDIPGWADPQLCGALLEMCGHIVGHGGGIRGFPADQARAQSDG